MLTKRVTQKILVSAWVVVSVFIMVVAVIDLTQFHRVEQGIAFGDAVRGYLEHLTDTFKWFAGFLTGGGALVKAFRRTP